MLGLSITELLVILIVAAVLINPADIPDVARWIAKFVVKIKTYMAQIRNELSELEKELGLDEIKEEINAASVSEKISLTDESEDHTTIIDMYGNEHKVSNVKSLRPDLTDDELSQEIESNNKKNTTKAKKQKTKSASSKTKNSISKTKVVKANKAKTPKKA